MQDFAEWLRDSALNNFLEPGASWIIPTLQTIHILAIAVVVSSILMVNGRLIRSTLVNQTVPQTASRFLPWMWVALVVLLCTGLILILMEPVRTLGKWIFWAKMGAIVIAALMTVRFQRDIRDNPEDWNAETVRPAFAWFAGINALLWIFIIFAGRWIAYV